MSDQKSKWIEFVEFPAPGRKTKVWFIRPNDGSPDIGQVEWYGPWRQYCFWNAKHAIFEKQCLRDIADFCEEQTKAHRSKPTLQASAAGLQQVSPACEATDHPPAADDIQNHGSD